MGAGDGYGPDDSFGGHGNLSQSRKKLPHELPDGPPMIRMVPESVIYKQPAYAREAPATETYSGRFPRLHRLLQRIRPRE